MYKKSNTRNCGAWDPSILFSKGQNGAYFNLKDSIPFSDNSGIVPCNAGDPIRKLTDLSGNANDGYQNNADTNYCMTYEVNPARAKGNGIPNDSTKYGSILINLPHNKVWYYCYVTFGGIVFDKGTSPSGQQQLPVGNTRFIPNAANIFSLTCPDFSALIIRETPFSQFEKNTIHLYFKDVVNPFYIYKPDDLIRLRFRTAGSKTIALTGSNIGTHFYLNGTYYGDTFSNVTVNADDTLIVRAAAPENVTSMMLNARGLNLDFLKPNAFPNCTQFYFSTNPMAGSLADDWTNCTELQLFRFNTCSLSGTFPDLTNCHKLQQIQCNQNAFSGPLPDFSKNTQLTTLLILYNYFSGLVSNVFPATLVNFQATSNQFTQSDVDNILIGLVNAGGINGVCYLDGTNEAPSAIGLAAKSILQSRGWTVVTN